MHIAPYILPTGEKMNPCSPETATYFDEGQVAFIMQKEGSNKPTRVFTSFGGLGGEWEIGTVHKCKHDQTGGTMGIFTVVGTAVYKTGEKQGNVPDRKLAHAVFK